MWLPYHNPPSIPASVADIPLPVCMNYYSTCLRQVGLCRPCLLVIGLCHSVLSYSEFIRVVELNNSWTVQNKSWVFKTESHITVLRPFVHLLKDVCTSSMGRLAGTNVAYAWMYKYLRDGVYSSLRFVPRSQTDNWLLISWNGYFKSLIIEVIYYIWEILETLTCALTVFSGRLYYYHSTKGGSDFSKVMWFVQNGARL